MAPVTRMQRRHTAEQAQAQTLADLPDEILLTHVLSTFDFVDLCHMACTNKRNQDLAACDKLWRDLFESRWPENTIYEPASRLAGSWRQLMKAKHLRDASSGGWNRPCEFEMKAMLNRLAATAMTAVHGTGKASPSDAPASPTSHLSASLALSPAPSRTSTITSPSSPSTSTSTPLAGASSMPNPFALHHRYSGTVASSPLHASPASCSHPAAYAPHQPLLLRTSLGGGASSDTDMMMSMASGSSPCSDAGCFTAGSLLAGLVTQAIPRPRPEVQLVYLLDGSGSVSEEDFHEMKLFVTQSAVALCEVLGAGVGPQGGKVAVIQFSTEPRVEIPLAPLEEGGAGLAAALDAIVRMNGGTNIATAIARAGSLMKSEDQAGLAPPPPPPAPPGPPGLEEEEEEEEGEDAPVAIPAPPPLPSRLVHGPYATANAELARRRSSTSVGSGSMGPCGMVGPGLRAAKARPIRLVLLLTDGRVDTYQAREARATACRLSDELSGATLAAFGVGRGVDRTELLHIIDTPQGDAHSRYMDLFTRDDAPW